MLLSYYLCNIVEVGMVRLHRRGRGIEGPPPDLHLDKKNRSKQPQNATQFNGTQLFYSIFGTTINWLVSKLVAHGDDGHKTDRQ